MSALSLFDCALLLSRAEVETRTPSGDLSDASSLPPLPSCAVMSPRLPHHLLSASDLCVSVNDSPIRRGQLTPLAPQSALRISRRIPQGEVAESFVVLRFRSPAVHEAVCSIADVMMNSMTLAGAGAASDPSLRQHALEAAAVALNGAITATASAAVTRASMVLDCGLLASPTPLALLAGLLGKLSRGGEGHGPSSSSAFSLKSLLGRGSREAVWAPAFFLLSHKALLRFKPNDGLKLSRKGLLEGVAASHDSSTEAGAPFCDEGNALVAALRDHGWPLLYLDQVAPPSAGAPSFAPRDEILLSSVVDVVIDGSIVSAADQEAAASLLAEGGNKAYADLLAGIGSFAGTSGERRLPLPSAKKSIQSAAKGSQARAVAQPRSAGASPVPVVAHGQRRASATSGGSSLSGASGTSGGMFPRSRSGSAASVGHTSSGLDSRATTAGSEDSAFTFAEEDHHGQESRVVVDGAADAADGTGAGGGGRAHLASDIILPHLRQHGSSASMFPGVIGAAVTASAARTTAGAAPGNAVVTPTPEASAAVEAAAKGAVESLFQTSGVPLPPAGFALVLREPATGHHAVRLFEAPNALVARLWTAAIASAVDNYRLRSYLAEAASCAPNALPALPRLLNATEDGNRAIEAAAQALVLKRAGVTGVEGEDADESEAGRVEATAVAEEESTVEQEDRRPTISVAPAGALGRIPPLTSGEPLAVALSTASPVAAHVRRLSGSATAATVGATGSTVEVTMLRADHTSQAISGQQVTGSNVAVPSATAITSLGDFAPRPAPLLASLSALPSGASNEEPQPTDRVDDAMMFEMIVNLSSAHCADAADTVAGRSTATARGVTARGTARSSIHAAPATGAVGGTQAGEGLEEPANHSAAEEGDIGHSKDGASSKLPQPIAAANPRPQPRSKPEMQQPQESVQEQLEEEQSLTFTLPLLGLSDGRTPSRPTPEVSKPAQPAPSPALVVPPTFPPLADDEIVEGYWSFAGPQDAFPASSAATPATTAAAPATSRREGEEEAVVAHVAASNNAASELPSSVPAPVPADSSGNQDEEGGEAILIPANSLHSHSGSAGSGILGRSSFALGADSTAAAAGVPSPLPRTPPGVPPQANATTHSSGTATPVRTAGTPPLPLATSAPGHGGGESTQAEMAGSHQQGAFHLSWMFSPSQLLSPSFFSPLPSVSSSATTATEFTETTKAKKPQPTIPEGDEAAESPATPVPQPAQPLPAPPQEQSRLNEEEGSKPHHVIAASVPSLALPPVSSLLATAGDDAEATTSKPKELVIDTPADHRGHILARKGSASTGASSGSSAGSATSALPTSHSTASPLTSAKSLVGKDKREPKTINGGGGKKKDITSPVPTRGLGLNLAAIQDAQKAPIQQAPTPAIRAAQASTDAHKRLPPASPPSANVPAVVPRFISSAALPSSNHRLPAKLAHARGRSSNNVALKMPPATRPESDAATPQRKPAVPTQALSATRQQRPSETPALRADNTTRTKVASKSSSRQPQSQAFDLQALAEEEKGLASYQRSTSASSAKRMGRSHSRNASRASSSASSSAPKVSVRMIPEEVTLAQQEAAKRAEERKRRLAAEKEQERLAKESEAAVRKERLRRLEMEIAEAAVAAAATPAPLPRERSVSAASRGLITPGCSHGHHYFTSAGIDSEAGVDSASGHAARCYACRHSPHQSKYPHSAAEAAIERARSASMDAGSQDGRSRGLSSSRSRSRVPSLLTPGRLPRSRADSGASSVASSVFRYDTGLRDAVQRGTVKALVEAALFPQDLQHPSAASSKSRRSSLNQAHDFIVLAPGDSAASVDVSTDGGSPFKLSITARQAIAAAAKALREATPAEPAAGSHVSSVVSSARTDTSAHFYPAVAATNSQDGDADPLKAMCALERKISRAAVEAAERYQRSLQAQLPAVQRQGHKKEEAERHELTHVTPEKSRKSRLSYLPLQSSPPSSSSSVVSASEPAVPQPLAASDNIDKGLEASLLKSGSWSRRASALRKSQLLKQELDRTLEAAEKVSTSVSSQRSLLEGSVGGAAATAFAVHDYAPAEGAWASDKNDETLAADEGEAEAVSAIARGGEDTTLQYQYPCEQTMTEDEDAQSAIEEGEAEDAVASAASGGVGAYNPFDDSEHEDDGEGDRNAAMLSGEPGASSARGKDNSGDGEAEGEYFLEAELEGEEVTVDGGDLLLDGASGNGGGDAGRTAAQRLWEECTELLIDGNA